MSDPLGAARELAPLIEAEAEAGEAACEITAEVVDALDAAGLFGLMVPRELGGTEAGLCTTLAVYEELSRADGSTGWSVLANATTSAFAGAYTGNDAARAMFGGPGRAIHAGMFAPVGTAEAVDGGYRVSGQYRFGSGSEHATWMGGGTFERRDGELVVDPDNGLPVIRAFFVPKDRVEMRGNWDVMGLVGTGSFDYDVPEQFVEAGYTFPLLTPTVHRGGPVYHLGVLGLTSAGHAAFALGVGRRALDELTAIVRTKQRLGSAPVHDQQLFQHDFALHDAALLAARAFVFDVFGNAEATVGAGSEASPLQLQRLRQATTYATRVSADAVRFAYLWAGSDALRSPSALQRCFRDIHAGTQHVFVDNNTLTATAQLLLGEATPS
ncbi:MAG TPA: acyl-CoA dehydrogenase family protein [Acidimicrobiia bacterium]|nr:acyl-CoA dehydrogenase family protein [Acidimicrobiia bacterium]